MEQDMKKMNITEEGMAKGGKISHRSLIIIKRKRINFLYIFAHCQSHAKQMNYVLLSEKKTILNIMDQISDESKKCTYDNKNLKC